MGMSKGEKQPWQGEQHVAKALRLDHENLRRLELKQRTYGWKRERWGEGQVSV